MSFLSVVKPLLTKGSEIQLYIAHKDNALSVTVIPKLSRVNEDHDVDEEDKDATVAALELALTQPLHLKIKDGTDPDEALRAALMGMGEGHVETNDQLDAYRASLKAAQQAAKEAQDAKAAKAQEKAKEKTKAAAAKVSAKPVKSAKTKPDTAAEKKATPPTKEVSTKPPLAATKPPEAPEPDLFSTALTTFQASVAEKGTSQTAVVGDLEGQADATQDSIDSSTKEIEVTGETKEEAQTKAEETEGAA